MVENVINAVMLLGVPAACVTAPEDYRQI